MVGKVISHYRILEKLGEGGMGVVYKAQDTKLDRIVALKFLPKHLLCDEEAKTRFVHEAKTASVLNHPNITTIYEIDEAEDECFISMEYVQGESLKELIKSKQIQKWDMAKIMDVGIQITEGLSKAHLKGIVHRDIKSDNIMLTNEGLVKIMDFGLAKLKGLTHSTKPGTTLGTVPYMSPEQAQGKQFDHRSDIFSLGVVFYEMITCQLPFKGNYEQAVIYAILNENPEPLASLRAEVPTELELIVNKALAKGPDSRYQKAGDILIDLRKLRQQLESINSRKRPSIAVLPFTNLSADKEQEFFCDGMAEEIINALTHVEGLRVVARTSAFSFRGKETDIREIGKKLNVETLLEGSVQKAGNRLRITAQLANVADGYHLWSEKYDRDTEDVFAIQDEISLAIVDKLKIQLLGKEKAKLVTRYTDNLEAYNLYLKGRYFWSKRTEQDIKRAIQYFEQAIERDPDYALAYAGMADCHVVLAEYSLLPPKEAFPRAKAAVIKALEIDETLAEAHTSLAFIKTFSDWDWMGAEREFKQAIELNPSYANARQWYGEYLTMKGQYAEATAEFERAQELDPLSLIIGVASAVNLFCGTRQYDQVIEKCQKLLEMDPNFGGVLNVLGMAYREKAMYEEAIQAFQKARTFDEGNTWVRAELGHAYALSGNISQAQKVLEELKRLSKRRYVPPDNIALVYLGLGKKDLTFEYLEKAYQDRSVGLSWLKADPVFDSLRSDPRFMALLKRIGLEK